ncbi:MAG TPA: hypothetical protein VJR06_04655, partial [Nitrososphaerales archaeon]|nr:hypothetical protein [Nitrososphaerales archaeon]
MSFDSISPIDGRYRREAAPLRRYFSDRALAGQRVEIEASYLRLLARLGVAPRARVPRFEVDMDELERLEEKLGHDV